MPRKKHNNLDDIPGLTMAFTTPYIIVSVIVMMAWLLLQGMLSLTWAIVLGSPATIGLILVQRYLFQHLLRNKVSRVGCLVGLYSYGICVVAWIILFWVAGLSGAVLGVGLVPLGSIAGALLVTARELGHNRRQSRINMRRRR